jgi:5'-nucleotidase
MKPSDPIALIDMDGTICDFDAAMRDQLLVLMGPLEALAIGDNIPIYDDTIPYLKARRDLVKRQPGFWRNLPPIPEGFAVLERMRKVGFNINILTKGPHNTTSAWSEKVDWCRQYVPDAQVTITETKSIVYGRVLFDDWPSYIKGWLEWRPRGLVVMLDSVWNRDFEHPNVFRYLRGLTGDAWAKQENDLERLLQEAFAR